jgi:hypothetical protein
MAEVAEEAGGIAEDAGGLAEKPAALPKRAGGMMACVLARRTAGRPSLLRAPSCCATAKVAS